MLQLTSSINKYPARMSLLWYVGVILLGSAVLRLPACSANPEKVITWTDALFTSTSATCVTGLVVRSTGHDFSTLGQVVILLLIQLGGIGIMTVTTFIMFSWGEERAGLRERALLFETLGADPGTDLRWVLRNVILMTFSFEGIGFALLAVRNAMDMPLGSALWHALFHSVSAFCNAGFALNDDSFVRYQADPLVSLTLCGLIIAGGLGFPVILDLWRNRRFFRDDYWRRLRLHSKMMLIGTAGLLVFGTLAFLVLERSDVLEELSWRSRLLVAFFHSVTTRTAGFNTVDVASLTNATLCVTMLLMMIGAGACSTGGGFKVSTFVTLVVRAWWSMRGHRQVNVFRRTIPEEAFDRAIVTAFLFAVVLVAGLTSLLALEQASVPHRQTSGIFLDAAFEVTSALGTVGLSTGITPHLTLGGRFVIMALMLLGRLGPISVFVAISRSERVEPIAMPEEQPLIG
ncbi:MAG: hypothetical protein GXP27_03480 [Planctomycetes bacterium]|nr:hypothetical protein [Planctomycetota bacterium]